MGGWKTWTAGLSAVFLGLIMIVAAIVQPIVSVVSAIKAGNYAEIGNVDWGGAWLDMQAGFAFMVGGLGLIGIGHKFEKGSPKAAEFQAQVDRAVLATLQAMRAKAAGVAGQQTNMPVGAPGSTLHG